MDAFQRETASRAALTQPRVRIHVTYVLWLFLYLSAASSAAMVQQQQQQPPQQGTEAPAGVLQAPAAAAGGAGLTLRSDAAAAAGGTAEAPADGPLDPSVNPAAAGDYCSRLQDTLCDEKVFPVGVVPKKCGSKVCGFTIKTVKRSPCSAEQKDLLSRLLPLCDCTAQLADALARAPSLVQPGQVAITRFAGVDGGILKEAADAVQCLESAGFPSLDVNEEELVALLDTNLKSVKPLAGINAFQVIQMQTLRIGDVQVAMSSLQACLEGEAPGTDPTSQATIPGHCEDFVQWFDEHSAQARTTLVMMVKEVQRQFLNFLLDVNANLAAVTIEVQNMVSPDPWRSVFAAAAIQAAALECNDPTTCYDGLLAGPWQKLQELAASLTGTHPALDTAVQAMAMTEAYRQQGQSTFCVFIRKATDTEFRQLSIYRGLIAASENADYPLSSLTEHPEILSDILVHTLDLPLIPQLALAVASVRDAAKETQRQLAAAAQESLGRYTAALKQMASDNYAILNILRNNGNKCADGLTTPLACPVNMCDASASPAPPGCPDGTRCVTDGCNGCQATCALSPASSNAIAIMQTWMDLIRDSDLSKLGDSVKLGINNVVETLTYIVTETSSAASKSYMYQSGMLTYNEAGKASGSFPCFQGTARMCYSMKGFKRQCMLVPRVGACLVKMNWAMPNEHVPWVALHSGVPPMIYEASDRIRAFLHNVTDFPAPPCS